MVHNFCILKAMVKEADIDRIAVPDGYDVLDATALGQRLGLSARWRNGRRGGKMGKRGNGEGGISRRKDGLYMARYTIQTATGAKRKTLYGKTRREVDEKLTKAKADRDGGLVFDAD